MKNFLVPRLRDILFIAILAAALALGPHMLSLDSDLGRHLTLGGFILDSQQIPNHDLFSHTRTGDSRPAYEWLTQVILAGADRLAGLDGVVLVTALVIAIALTIVYVNAARRSHFPLAALMIAVLATAASSLHWLPRPHVATFLFLALWIERLERVRRAEFVPVWHFPVLMFLWVNAHGGFIFGNLAWAAYFAGWVWEFVRKSANLQIGRKLLVIGGTSMISTIITPSLFGNWQAILSNNSQYILGRTIETMPADFTQPGIWPFALLLFFVILSPLLARKSPPAAHIFLLAGFAVMGLVMVRNIPLFAIAAAPILAENVSNALGHVKRWTIIESNITSLENPLRGAIWPILFGLGFILFIGVRYQVQNESLTHFDVHVFPVAAVDWLDEHPQSGNMFNEINWGGYLLYRLWPEQKVFLDSQTDFYGEALVREYETSLTMREGWEEIFSKYQIEWVILPANSELMRALGNDPAWDTLYTDSTAVIMRQK